VLAAFSKQRAITFPLLSDAGSATIKAFGLLNPAAEWALGPDSDDPAIAAEIQKYVSGGRATQSMAGIAFPGTFILDRQGRVTARFFEDSYVERNTTSSVMLEVGAGTTPVSVRRIVSAQADIATFASDASVTVGNRFSLIFDITPRRGMHVYAPGATGYRVVTSSIRPQPFVKVEEIQYPPSEIYFFKPLNERVPVYQKPFRLIQAILIEGTPQAQAAFQGQESLTIVGSLEYQACDDKLCYDPMTVPLTWTVSLKPLIRERPPVR
jgi:hypothetical protein